MYRAKELQLQRPVGIGEVAIPVPSSIEIRVVAPTME